MLTAEKAREILAYDPETGELRWKVYRGSFGRHRKPGDLIKVINGSGYVVFKFDGKFYMGHRVIWLIMTGRWPERTIDHKNRIRSDNRWENLREATMNQQQGNRRMAKNNTSGFRGVSFKALFGKWEASVGNAQHRLFLGRYSTKEAAASAYREAAVEWFGADFYRE